MPIYAYRCTTCGHAKDVLRKMSDPALTDCPECGAPTFVKQVTAAGFQLKGSGWYVTDFRGDAKAKSAADAKGEGGKGESAKGDSAKGDSAKSDSAKGDVPKPAADRAAGPASSGAARSEPAPTPAPAASPAPATTPKSGTK